MLKKEVEVGGVYKAKISGRVVPVKLLEPARTKGWHAINLWTNRNVHIRSAAKLRGEYHKLPHACCLKARPRQCVCAFSYDCPDHGQKHVGTHD